MAKERTGSVFSRDGVWYGRITFTDESGKRRYVKRRANNKTHAREIIRRLLDGIKNQGEKFIESERMTFNELADFHTKHYLIPANYVDGRKVAGLRTYKDGLFYLRTLRECFGKRRLRSITHGDVERYKAERLATPTARGKQRSISNVNHELSLLRRMFNVAFREGWIYRSPFQAGDRIISLADEKKRERILTREEEERLLEQCVGQRTHLRPIIICALDTGMRQGEILSLRWPDVDFQEKIITIQSFHTKTMHERQVAMTTRLERELWELHQRATDPKGLVFGIADNVKTAFTNARNQAGLPDVRFHDLRHTAATRLVALHLPLSEVGRVLGHTQPVTTYRYVNANLETVRRAAMALDAFHAERETDASDNLQEVVN